LKITLGPKQEQVIAEALQSGGYRSPDEVIERALEVFQSEEVWLHEHRDAIDAKIRLGMEQLDRGEGISEDELDDALARLESAPE